MMQDNINHCFVDVFHRYVQRRYVVGIKIKGVYVRYVLLNCDQVSYSLIRFIHLISPSAVVDLCDLIRATPPKLYL